MAEIINRQEIAGLIAWFQAVGCAKEARAACRQAAVRQQIAAASKESDLVNRWNLVFKAKAPEGRRTPRRYGAVGTLENAPASWSAVALYRFSPPLDAGRPKGILRRGAVETSS